MDPMKPVCQEPNEITMPSLKESIQEDVDILDGYFRTAGMAENDEAKIAFFKKVRGSWFNVREAAISFAETFDKMKGQNEA